MLAVCGEGGPGCEWFVPPAEPGSAAAKAQQADSLAFERKSRKAAEQRLGKSFHSVSTVSERR
jgi:hypothetical protein